MGGIWKGLILSLVLSGALSPAFAEPPGKGGYVAFAVNGGIPEDLAPVPDGFEAQPTATVRGVFARAVSSENQFDLEDELSAASRTCIARGRNLEYAGDTRRRNETSYWLYRSGTEAAVFVSRVRARFDTDHCRVTFEEKREVHRSTEKAGSWPSPFASSSLKCSGLARKCYTTTLHGIKARCRAEGNGFQGTRDCLSIERNTSKGLLLESVYESDDMSGHGFAVSELKVDVPIDASLFDRAKAW